MPSAKSTESPADRRARVAAELAELEREDITTAVASTKPPHGPSLGPERHGHGAGGPYPFGVGPLGAEVDMPEAYKPVERSRHRSPVTAPQGGH
jgi:hypothetical protein